MLETLCPGQLGFKDDGIQHTPSKSPGRSPVAIRALTRPSSSGQGVFGEGHAGWWRPFLCLHKPEGTKAGLVSFQGPVETVALPFVAGQQPASRVESSSA